MMSILSGHRFNGALVTGVALLSQLLAGTSPCRGQTSAWLINTGSGNWFDASHWDNGVPNGAGVIAKLPGNSTFAVQLNQQATVGQLIFTGPRQTNLSGTGQLVFDRPGSDPALIQATASSTGAAITAAIDNPLSIAAGEQLWIDLDAPTTLALSGAITSSNGHVTKAGLGTLTLSGNSAAWNGKLTVSAGRTIIASGGALGTTVGNTLVSSGGILTLQSATLESMDLNGGTLETSTASAVVLSNPIHLIGNGTINNVSSTAGATLNNLIDGGGDLTVKNSAATAMIIGGANTYSGQTFVSGTSFRATTGTAFGDATAGTTLQSGALSVEASTSELFTVTGGALSLVAATASYNKPVTLNGGTLKLPSVATALPTPVVAGSAGGIVQFAGTANWSGGSSGAGNLQLTGTVAVNAALNHQGSLAFQSATLNVANSYQGETIVTGDSAVNHVDALGTSPTVRIRQLSTLTLNVVPSNDPDFVLESGSVRFNDLSRPINGDITFKGGNPPSVYGQTTYNGNIHADQTSGSGYLRAGTFNGVISGTGNLDFAALNGLPTDNYNVTLNGESTFTGTSRIDGIVHSNSPHALGSWDRGTFVGNNGVLNLNAATSERVLVSTGGRVNINATVTPLPVLVQDFSSTIFRGTQTVAVNVPNIYHQHYDVNQGLLEINANTTVDSLSIRNGGKVLVNQGVLTTAAPIDLHNGDLAGRIVGASSIRKHTNEFAHLGDLPGFAGDIIVEKGVLQIDAGSLGTATGVTRVQGTRDAALVARGDSTIMDDVFLNNATGIDYQGGLRLDYEFYPQTLHVNMQGRLDLGTVGSIIGGTRSGIIDAFGPVTGGSLTKVGTGFWMNIQGNQNTYTGATHVRQGLFAVEGDGRLSSTSAIVLYDDVGSDKGTLYLDNGTPSQTDRIADTVPIEFRGGRLYVQDFGGEKFGAFKFLEGDSEVDIFGSIGVGSISRQAGATGFTWLRHATPVDVAPQAVNGVIPWMIIRDSFSPGTYDSFGTVVNGQLRALPSSAYVNDINSAAATNNIHVAGSPTALASDRTVNALALEGSATLDLGGHTLQVESGGIIFGYGGTIKNGRVTAGSGSGNELVFHSAGSVSADIVDNPSGPVNVTFSPESPGYGAYLSGNNSYTGTTYINTGQMSVIAASALPDGADLQITGGDVTFNYSSTGLRHVGDVRIASHGSLRNLTNGTFSFDQVVLEDGSFSPGKLVGSAHIFKRTTGTGEIAGATTGSTYNGQITVEEGRLSVSGLPNAQLLVTGGTLVMPTGANNLTLAGGEFEYLYFTGNFTVNQPSRIIPQFRGNSQNFGLTGSFSGNGDILFQNRPYPGDSNNVNETSAAAAMVALRGHSPLFSGNIDIDSSSASMLFADSLGTGNITIHPDGELALTPQQANFDGAKLDLLNDVYLAGGELTGVSSVFRPQRLLGNLFVSGNSWIGTLEIPGTVHLADGSRLTTTEHYDTRLTGDVLVGGTVEFRVGRTTVRSSALQADRGTVQLGARIVSDAPMSLLKIENAGLDDLVLASSISVKPGQTLGILSGGEAIPLRLAGGALTGGGTLLNPILVEAGAHLSPGQSPGKLTFASDLTIGPAAVYDWEINNANGTAGDSNGWDLLDVGGQLAFTASPAVPFALRVVGLDELPLSSFSSANLAGRHSWLIASAASIVGFDLNSVAVQPVDSPNRLRTVLPQQLTLEVAGGNLYLVYQIPEPSGLALAGLGVTAFTIRRQRSAGRSSRDNHS